MQTWTHASLGTFALNYGVWRQERRPFDAFDAFSDVWRTIDFELCATDISETNEHGPPAAECIALATLAVERLPQLLSECVRALWQDLTNTGRVSGMWWHDNLAHAFEYCDDDRPSTEMDLYRLLSPTGIAVEQTRGWSELGVRIEFTSDFEEEHGISFLSNGAAIVGVGYGGDPSPFRTT